jgi:hypothetical protein
MKKELFFHRIRLRIRRWMLEHPIAALTSVGVGLILIYISVDWVLPSAVDRDLLQSALGGLLASLAAYSLVQYFYLQRSHFSLRKWLKVGHRPIWIVPTTIPQLSEPRYAPRQYYVIPPFDAQAAGLLTEVYREAGYRFPQRRSIGSHLLDENVLSDNLVLMCLPSRNTFTRVFLGLYYDWFAEGLNRQKLIAKAHWERYKLDTECNLQYYGLRKNPTKETEWQMLDWSEPAATQWKTSSINKWGIEAVHVPGGEPDTDFAMVIRAPNPFNPEASVVIVSGIHGIGTFGAALWLYKSATSLLTEFTDDAQAHLLRIDYRVPPGRDNYVDAVIVPPIKRVGSNYPLRAG